MTLVGAVATHYHPDHIGGSLIGSQHVAGIVELREMTGVPIHVNEHEVSWIIERTGIDEAALVAHEDRDQLNVGDVQVTLLHTPGPHPGEPVPARRGWLAERRHAVHRRVRAHRLSRWGRS